MNKKQIIFLIIGVLFFGVFLNHAMAALSPVSGYAWSENIGWIHFNPPFGGVFLDVVFPGTIFNFTGYAWSENIGWVDFAPTSGFPAAPSHGVQLDSITGKVSGWAKAVAGGTSGSGGWDGWISMSGTAPNYEVNVDYGGTGDFSGWAWASDVVGWISFSGDTAGAGGGDYKVTIGQTIPADPTNLSATAGTGVNCETISIAWTDNANNEISYKVERKTTGAFSEIASLPANTTTYKDTGLTGGITYTYRVRACNAVGCSNYSNEAGATTVACAALPFFTLNSSGAIYATLIGTAPAVSSNTTITVSPQGGFNENVSLSSNVSSVISGATDSFSDTTLSSGEYASGSTFSITVPASTAKGLYTITVTGTSPSFTGSIDVNLNIESLNPKWKEI